MSENTSAPTAQQVLNEPGGQGYYKFVKGLFNRSGDLSKDFTHAILGIVTELHEYQNAHDEVNAIEEAGDASFYYVAMGQVLEDAFGELETHAAIEAVTPLRVAELYDALTSCPSAQVALREQGVILLDIAKRWVGYGKAPEDVAAAADIATRCALLIGVVLDSGLLGEADYVDRALTANIEKLRLRYKGDAFNAERAVNRDIEAERDVLERASQ